MVLECHGKGWFCGLRVRGNHNKMGTNRPTHAKQARHIKIAFFLDFLLSRPAEVSISPLLSFVLLRHLIENCFSVLSCVTVSPPHPTVDMATSARCSLAGYYLGMAPIPWHEYEYQCL